MKIAAIDLGTNTFHLIIADAEGDDIKVIYKTNSPVKLGEDITKENKIIPVAFERGIACLKNFKATLTQHNVTKLRAVATSGVRSASNGLAFIATVKEVTGITIDIVDGDEEASLIYEGVKLSGAITGKSVIMDIGGGSTEFIFCDENGFYWKKSYNIGAARLMQKYFKSDPISIEDQDTIHLNLKKVLIDLVEFNQTFGAKTLIGSAGAFETYTAMISPSTDLDRTPTTTISLADYYSLSTKLINSTHQERSEMPNLIPLRVDMIVMASILTNYVLKELNIEEITVSSYDLKMGVLTTLAN